MVKGMLRMDEGGVIEDSWDTVGKVVRVHLIVHKVEYTLYVSSHVLYDEIVFTNEILRIIVHQRIGTYNRERIYDAKTTMMMGSG